MKKKIIEKKVFEDMYEVEVSFLFGGDVDELKKFMRSKHGSDAKFWSWEEEFKLYEQENNTNAYSFHVFTPVGNADIFYIWFGELTPSLLFHEVYHQTNDLINTIGSKMASESEECHAYLCGWIGKEICKILKIIPKMPRA